MVKEKKSKNIGLKKNIQAEPKERFNFFITDGNKILLDKASEISKKTRGQILNAIIEERLSDPIEVLRDQNRELVKKIYLNRQRIEDLQDKITPSQSKST